jgi:hypothetical protein
MDNFTFTFYVKNSEQKILLLWTSVSARLHSNLPTHATGEKACVLLQNTSTITHSQQIPLMVIWFAAEWCVCAATDPDLELKPLESPEAFPWSFTSPTSIQWWGYECVAWRLYPTTAHVSVTWCGSAWYVFMAWYLIKLMYLNWKIPRVERFMEQKRINKSTGLLWPDSANKLE